MTEPRTRVLVIEDEAPMRRFLRATLSSHGYEAMEAATAADGIAMATQHAPELVIVDLGLPDRDGLEVTREIRGWSRVPIIVLSARGREDDKVQVLDAGADDYLTKPFGVNELLARIRVALRHVQTTSASDPVIAIGPIRIDPAHHAVSLRGEPLRLTRIEYRLLLFLARHPGRVLTHRQLLIEVWGPHAASQTHYLRVYMAQLRKKIELDPARPKLLSNEPGVGYRMTDAPPDDPTA